MTSSSTLDLSLSSRTGMGAPGVESPGEASNVNFLTSDDQTMSPSPSPQVDAPCPMSAQPTPPKAITPLLSSPDYRDSQPQLKDSVNTTALYQDDKGTTVSTGPIRTRKRPTSLPPGDKVHPEVYSHRPTTT